MTPKINYNLKWTFALQNFHLACFCLFLLLSHFFLNTLQCINVHFIKFINKLNLSNNSFFSIDTSPKTA